jgi:hypothetical protein
MRCLLFVVLPGHSGVPRVVLDNARQVNKDHGIQARTPKIQGERLVTDDGSLCVERVVEKRSPSVRP